MVEDKRITVFRFLAEPTHVNFGGKVHGGIVMKWIDQAGYACATHWSGSYCVTVYVDVLCGEVFVPNAFSPNGDGSNDCLKVYSNCLETVLFRVYSRWGELIYESEDVDGCWDGTNNGSDLNTGVYTYTVQATLINGEEIDKKGNTTLFK